jgi:hypothetical protein
MSPLIAQTLLVAAEWGALASGAFYADAPRERNLRFLSLGTLSSLSGPGRRTASSGLFSFLSTFVLPVLDHSFSRSLEAEAELLVGDGITPHPHLTL